MLDSAATKEKEAHKRLQAVQGACGTASKREARDPRGDAEGASPASRGEEKIAQSEALLAQYGLADVAPQPTPAPEASKAAQSGSSGYERIPIER